MCHAPDVHLIRITARGRPFPTLATQEGSMAQYETTCVQYCHHLAAIIMVSLSPKNVQKCLLNTFQVLSGDWKFTQPSEHCLHCTLTKQGRQHTTPTLTATCAAWAVTSAKAHVRTKHMQLLTASPTQSLAQRSYFTNINKQ